MSEMQQVVQKEQERMQGALCVCRHLGSLHVSDGGDFRINEKCLVKGCKCWQFTYPTNYDSDSDGSGLIFWLIIFFVIVAAISMFAK